MSEGAHVRIEAAAVIKTVFFFEAFAVCVYVCVCCPAGGGGWSFAFMDEAENSFSKW